MKNHAKINRNKQKQMNRKMKINKETAVYNTPEKYKVITKIDLTPETIDFELDLPYHHILFYPKEFTPIDLSYLARCSDLLLLTVTSNDIDQNLISLLKRYLPTSIIVYNGRQKAVARSVAKLFGDISICEASMINRILAKAQTSNTQLCKTRPFMVAREASYSIADGCLYVEGFMKNGLRSDKVVINGRHCGVIEEVAFEDTVVRGVDLNTPEDECLVKRCEDTVGSNDDEDDAEMSSGAMESDSDEASLDDVPEYDLVEPGEDAESLVTKYQDYRGILNLATCTFKDQELPPHYKDLIFMKGNKYAHNILATRHSIVPPNTCVRMKIRVFEEFSLNCLVIFNLYEFETRNTMHNYEFSSSTGIGKTVTVDSGHTIYSASTALTRNLNHNVFQIEPELTSGVVSFIGPFSFFSSTAHIIEEDGTATKLLNGRSADRVFFDCVQLRGRPIKIFKRYCVIKGMFSTRDEVAYFGNIRIEAKNANRGYIKKAMGTKGLFKAYFNHPIKHDDVVTMSLYKRVFL